MRKRFSKLAASFLSGALILSGPVSSPLTLRILAEELMSEKLSLNEKAVPAYSSVQVTFDAVEGHTYQVLKKAEDGTFVQAAAGLNAGSWTDQDAGIGTAPVYKIIDETDSSETAEFSSAKTGMESGLLYRHFSAGETAFDGTRSVDLLEGKDETLKSQISQMDYGTIAFRFKPEGSGPYVLMSARTDGEYFSTATKNGLADKTSGAMVIYVTEQNKVRLDFGGSVKGTYNYVLTPGQWHTVVVTNSGSVGEKCCRVSIDNTEVFSFAKSDALSGLFSRLGADPDEILIGAATASDGSRICGFTGEIDTVSVMNEYLTDAQAQALSAQRDPETTGTIDLQGTGKYSNISLNWTSTLTGPFDVYRDGTKVAQTSETAWTDSSAPKGNHVYKVVCGNSSSDEVQIANGLQSGILYHEFKGDEALFDGTKAYDLLQGADSDLISHVSAMDAGTVVVRFKDNGSKPYTVFSTRKEGTYLSASDTGLNNVPTGAQALYIQKSGVPRLDLGFTRTNTNGNVSSGSWHTIVLSNTSESGKKNLRITMDGTQIQGFTGRTDLNGLFNRVGGDLCEFLIGASRGSDGSLISQLNGEVAYAAILDEYVTDEEALEISGISSVKSIFSPLFDSSKDNTWVLTGGAAGAGDMNTIELSRTYAGHFEEVIRWELATSSYDLRQRHVINTSKKNQTIADLDAKYEERIGGLSPKAVSIMLDGNEALSDEQISTALKSIIEKNQAAGRRTLVQVPLLLDETEANRLARIAEEAVSEYEASKTVAMLNQNELITANKESLFTNGILNADGQLAVGNSMANELTGHTTTNTEWIKQPLDLFEIDSEVPAVTVKEDSIEVSIHDQDGWNAVVELNGQSYEKPVTDSKAVFSSLPADTDFKVTVYNADRSVRKISLYGTTGKQQTGEIRALSAKQQAVRDKISSAPKDQPLKWLFMGDSITHGCMHTKGGDNMFQVMEKFVHEELERPNDILINTGNSGAQVADTISSLAYRYEPYKDADFVVVMIGTNGSYTQEYFKQNMGSLIDTIEANGSTVILRMANKTQSKDLSAVHRYVQELAQEKDVLFVDHYDTWENGLEADTQFINYWNNNDFHPNHRGQLLMAQELLEVMGLDDGNFKIPLLAYTRNRPQNTSLQNVEPELVGKTVRYDGDALQSLLGGTIGEIEVTCEANGQKAIKTVSKTTAGSIGTVTLDLADLDPESVHVTVKASKNNDYATQIMVFDDVLDTNPAARLELSAKGLYSKAVLNWKTNQDGEAVILREGQEIARTSNLTSYTDTTASEGEHTYQVKIGDMTSEARTVTVGLEGSLIYRELKGDEQTLDGTNPIDLLENADSALISKVSSMTSGSIVIKFKDDGTTVPYALAGVSGGTGGVDKAQWPSNNPNSVLSLYVKANRLVREDVRGGSMKGETGNVAAGQWHTIVWMQSNDQTIGQGRVFMDGARLMGWNNTSLSDWFASLSNPVSKILIGGVPASDGTFAGGFKGQIAYAALMDEALTDEEAIRLTQGTLNPLNQIFDDQLDRTWVVTGGGLAGSDYSSTLLHRSYAQIFSEIISIDYRSSINGPYYPNRQRYVINTSRKGLTVKGVDQEYDRLVEKLNPKTVAVMLDGNESLSDKEITDALQSIIARNNEKLRATIIQIPPVQGTPSRDLAALVNSMLDTMDEETRKAVKVIDHEAAFGNNEDGFFNSDGSLNARGHLQVANQMSRSFGLNNSATVNDTTIAARTYQVEPAWNSQKPAVTVDGTTVRVEAELADAEAVLTIDGQSIVRPLENGAAVFKKLKNGSKFTLDVRTKDQTVQMIRMAGTVGTAGTAEAQYYDQLSALQQQIKDKVDSDKPLKWLFMGDSITHGVCTNGYSSVMQVFEHYVHEDLKRPEDIVINAGVSNADFLNLHDNFDQRYTHYQDADIVIMMLGTNDSAYSLTDERYVNFKKNMSDFVQLCQDNGQIVILRNPPKIVASSHAGHEARMDTLAGQLREIASEKNVLLADHYGMFVEKIFSDSTTAKAGGTWSADNIHPEAYGQLAMAKQLIQTMGLWDESSQIARTEYTPKTAWTKQTASVSPSVSQDEKTVRYDLSALETALSKTVGTAVLRISDGTTVIEKELVRKENASLGSIQIDAGDLTGEVNVEVRVTTIDAPNAGKIVYEGKADLGAPVQYTITFRHGDNKTKTVTLTEGTSAADVQKAAPAPDAKAGYLFDQWTPAFADVTANAVYTASYKVDKTALQSMIVQAGKVSQNDYEEADWTALQNALSSAQNVAADKDATPTDVQAALDTLTAAVSKTKEPITLNYSLLDQAIEYAEEIDLSTLIDGQQKETLRDANEQAKSVRSNAVIQGQIDQAASDLNDALLAVRLIPDKARLNALK